MTFTECNRSQINVTFLVTFQFVSCWQWKYCSTIDNIIFNLLHILIGIHFIFLFLSSPNLLVSVNDKHEAWTRFYLGILYKIITDDFKVWKVQLRISCSTIIVPWTFKLCYKQSLGKYFQKLNNTWTVLSLSLKTQLNNYSWV